MIISHLHQFVFIKTRKTGGTSVEIALASIVGAQDVVTPIHRESSMNITHVPRNHDGFRNHMSAVDIQSRLSPEVWHGYRKFTVERNPWDKMVSMYWWRVHQYRISDSFRNFCIKACQSEDAIYTCPTDYALYTVNGVSIVDHVIRYEYLEEDFSRVCRSLGLPSVPPLPHAKGGCRPRHATYETMYDDETRRLVANRFKNEIDVFGYTFEGRQEEICMKS